MQRVLDAVARAVERHPVLLLVGLALATVGLAVPATELQTETDLSAFGPDTELAERFADSHRVLRVSRYESGSPATGSHTIHVQEQEAILEAALNVEADTE